MKQVIKSPLKTLLARLDRANLLTFLALSAATLSLASCITRKEIEATVWRNNAPIPAAICAATPELHDYGFYRQLNDGGFEFVSFCAPEASQWLAIHESELKRILDRLDESTP